MLCFEFVLETVLIHTLDLDIAHQCLHRVERFSFSHFSKLNMGSPAAHSYQNLTTYIQCSQFVLELQF